MLGLSYELRVTVTFGAEVLRVTAAVVARAYAGGAPATMTQQDTIDSRRGATWRRLQAGLPPFRS